MDKCIFCNGELERLPSCFPCFHSRYRCKNCKAFFIPSLHIYERGDKTAKNIRM